MTVAYVSMPGTSGNYVSSADVNLLPTDDAHGHQSVGNWTAGAGASALIVTGSSAPAAMLFGTSAFKATTDGTGAVIASLTTPSLSGAEHTVSVDLYTTTAGREAFITLDGTDGTVTPLTASTVTRVSATKTVTAGTKTVTVTYRKTDDSDPAASEVVWMARACVRTGTSAVFVPSLRIVGDLDMRAKVRIPDFSPAADLYICGTWDFSNGGYALRNLAATGLSLAIRDSGGTNRYQNISQAQLGVADDDLIELRVTCDVSDPATGINWYVNDALVLNGGHAISGGIAVAAQPFQVGRAPAAGSSNYQPMDSYYVELRDGIDGPVVRRFDADDLIGLV